MIVEIFFRLFIESGLIVGGNANDGANAGLVYWNSNNTPSNANSNISSQLCLMYKTMETLPQKRQYVECLTFKARAKNNCLERSR
jgi:hypothetical protein